MIRLIYDNLDTPNASACEGIFKNDTLGGILSDFPDNFVKQTLGSYDKNTNGYYAVSPSWAEISFGESGPGFIKFVSPEALTRLQDPEDGLKLLIFFAWEGFDLEFKNHLLINYINLLISKYNINEKKIFFIFGDINVKQTLKLTPVKLNIPDNNVLGINGFEWVACQDLRKLNFRPSLGNALNRNKKFLCKNGVARPQRIYLAGAFYNKELLDKFYFSWLNHTKWEYDDHTLYAFSKYNNGKINKEFMNSFLEFIKDEPYILDITSKEATDRKNQIYNNTKLYNDSYASLVTETVVDSYNKGVLFVSEKTYQPIYNLHPFINVGGPGILKFLKSNGYATFPELFDESYDEIKDCSTRIHKIITEVEKFCNIDNRILDDIYSSKTFQDKLIHNITNFKDSKGKKDLEKIVKWLASYGNTDSKVIDTYWRYENIEEDHSLYRKNE